MRTRAIVGGCRLSSLSRWRDRVLYTLLTAMDSPRWMLVPKAHKLCAAHLGGAWSTVPMGALSVVPVSGGMSNFLYCCSLPPSATNQDTSVPSKVLLRLYGSMLPECDIATQLEILNQLSRMDLGPRIYGSFEGGRLEEFLPANSLTSDQLVDSEISAIIAKKLAAIHNLDLSRLKSLDNRWLLNRLCEWSKLVMEEDSKLSNSSSSSPSTSAAAAANHNNNNNSESSPAHSIADQLLTIDYEKEVDFIKAILSKIRSPQVFSHNDLHQGNILLATHSEQRSSLEDRVIIIDFEYCSYNYRAFDIANHFTEWCFEYDTDQFPHFNFDKSRFPSRQTQLTFARNYLSQVRLLSKTSSNGRTATESSNKGDDATDQQVTQADVEALVGEVQPFLMASNLMWALWCIRSARSSGIKFGYWEHAKARWQLYSEFKLNYINGTSAAELKSSNKKGCSESVVQNGAGSTASKETAAAGPGQSEGG